MIIARILASVAFAALPLTALADVSGSSLQGPSSTQSNGSSTGTLNTLQPASPSSGLQVTGTDGVGQSPDQSALQSNAGDQAKLLVQGDRDGSPQNLSGNSLSVYLDILGIIAVLVGVISLVRILVRYDQRHGTTPAGTTVTQHTSGSQAQKSTKATKKRKRKAKS